MKLVTLNTLFEISYGNQFDLNKLDAFEDAEINFVSRSSKNLGVIAKVALYKDIEPFEEGAITVTLGGTYLLSSFIQQAKFYTAQNIKVLKPRKEMSFLEKVFYCTAIEANRYKYVSHGREANSTLDFLLVPEQVPANFLKIESGKYLRINDVPILKPILKIKTTDWKTFKYGGKDGVFIIKNGYYNKKPDHVEIGTIPFIGATEYNNGITDYYSLDDIDVCDKAENSIHHELDKKIFKGNCVTVTNNGSVGYAFYQEHDFTCSHDVNVLLLRGKSWNKYIALFICSLIELERFRWAFGRKWRPSRMPDSEIKLPVDKNGNPDFNYMENYIKTLPYSASI